MILMYHNIVTDNAPSGYERTSITLTFSGFKRQINWLKKRFRIIPLSTYIEELKSGVLNQKKTICLTFDDGTAMTFDLMYPFFQDNDIPATIFVSTSQLENGRWIWGSVLNAICLEDRYAAIEFEGRRFDLKAQKKSRELCRQELFLMARNSGAPTEFVIALEKKYPVEAMYKPYYKGMTYEQLATAGTSKYIEIGAHTVNHPFLTDLSEDQQHYEILESKLELEKYTQREVRYFAYPNGDYDDMTIRLLKMAGFTGGIAVYPRKSVKDIWYELPRTGVYSNSIIKLWAKIYRESRKPMLR